MYVVHTSIFCYRFLTSITQKLYMQTCSWTSSVLCTSALFGHGLLFCSLELNLSRILAPKFYEYINLKRVYLIFTAVQVPVSLICTAP